MRFLCTALFLTSISFNLVSQTSQPNIIYILVDDLGYGDINLQNDLEVFNNHNLLTPNLARLARESLVFTDHYSASPVCSPSRAGLLTGRAPTRANINIYINDLKENDQFFLHGKELTVAEVLKQQGYQTAIFGKWHLNGADWEVKDNWTGWTGSFPKQQGFDHGIVTKEDPHFTRKLNVNSQKHPGDFFTVDGDPVGPIKGYSSDIISNSAIDWLEKRNNKEQPFFIYLPYDAVHIRIAAADRFEELYNTGDVRKDVYYANITHLDAAIGNLLTALEKMDLDENTLIFFSSDNGPDVLFNWDATYFCYGTSYPLYGEKYQLYEGGIRVPGMVRWPGKIKPGVSRLPNSTMDVLPTLAELTGASLPKDVAIDGQSILPHLVEGKDIQRKDPLYWQYEYQREYREIQGEGYQRRLIGPPPRDISEFRPRVKIREGNYTLLGYSNGQFEKPTEFRLYDLSVDIEEKNDISKQKPKILDAMKKKLLEKYEEVRMDQEATKALISKK